MGMDGLCLLVNVVYVGSGLCGQGESGDVGVVGYSLKVLVRLLPELADDFPVELVPLEQDPVQVLLLFFLIHIFLF